MEGQVKRSGRFRWEILVEWENVPISEATWEDWDVMKEQFPDFDLEDKVSLRGEE